MKKLLLLVAVMFPLLAHAWHDPSGKDVPDTESMRGDGDFGVRLVLTPDEKKFRQVWNSPTGSRTLTTTSSVRRGSSIAALLIFYGCAPNDSGQCDVVTEFAIEGPDGVKAPAGGGPVWSGAQLEAGSYRLGKASMKISFSDDDPGGNYKVIANVKDKNSGRTLPLSANFKVTK